MNNETVIREAQFNPKVKTYFVVGSCLAWAFSIIGILVLPIWIPIAFVVADKWFKSLQCILTNKTLIVRKGVLVKVEKTIPLDKITDLGSIQGPLMRAFGIESISVETAGSSVGGALVQLPGLIGVDDFRDAVLAQKEALIAKNSGMPQQSAPALPTSAVAEVADSEVVSLLREMRDSLRKLEERS
ncbi:MAG: PH domain-containing protein [Verrucomicrobiales bacterium]|nr:PH domain-containing protein [Verrucomicrobiales bacterium]